MTLKMILPNGVVQNLKELKYDEMYVCSLLKNAQIKTTSKLHVLSATIRHK